MQFQKSGDGERGADTLPGNPAFSPRYNPAGDSNRECVMAENKKIVSLILFFFFLHLTKYSRMQSFFLVYFIRTHTKERFQIKSPPRNHTRFVCSTLIYFQKYLSPLFTGTSLKYAPVWEGGRLRELSSLFLFCLILSFPLHPLLHPNSYQEEVSYPEAIG